MEKESMRLLTTHRRLRVMPLTLLRIIQRGDRQQQAGNAALNVRLKAFRRSHHKKETP